MTVKQFAAKPFFEPATEELRYLPECPRLLRNGPGGHGLLGWVAIQHDASRPKGSMNILDLSSGENRSVPVPGRPGFFAETTRAGVVLAGLERRLAYFNWITGEVEETGIAVTDDERTIINEGLAVDGGVLVGTKHLDCKQPVAGLYFFETATRKVHMLIDRQTCSNGKYLRRDAQGATLIDIDSIPKTISRYRLDRQLQHVLERSLVIAPDLLPGLPDGLRPAPADEYGPEGSSVIVAFYNPEPVSDGVAWQIRLKDGAVLSEWRIPGSPRVTCPEFVEMEGQVKLVFTTAVEGMLPEARRLAPGAGSLYVADTPFDRMPSPPPLVQA